MYGLRGGNYSNVEFLNLSLSQFTDSGFIPRLFLKEKGFTSLQILAFIS